MKKIFLLILLIVIYQISYSIFPIKNYLPSIPDILSGVVRNFSDKYIYNHIFASLQRVLVGFLFATIMGTSLGILIGYNKYLRGLKFYIELLRPIPPIAWIPIAIMIFGLGDRSAYFIVFLGALFPIFTNTYFGVISLPTIYRNVALSFELNKFTYITRVVFFYSLPYIFTGLKIGIGMAWMSVIAAELIGSQSGLGYFIQLNRLLLQTDNIIIGMILIGVMGYLLNRIIDFVEKIVIRWKI